MGYVAIPQEVGGLPKTVVFEQLSCTSERHSET